MLTTKRSGQKKNTYVPYDGYIRAHQNNGHALFNSFYFNGKLRIAGSETALIFQDIWTGLFVRRRRFLNN
ncbi:MAG: hypothetical protein R2788_20400 [Saprospiraceae bacterium]